MMYDLTEMASAFKRALRLEIPDETDRLHAALKIDEAVFLAKRSEEGDPAKS